MTSPVIQIMQLPHASGLPLPAYAGRMPAGCRCQPMPLMVLSAWICVPP